MWPDTKLMQWYCRAHAEIDSIIGHDRSPAWSDWSKLPYINMIIKESHRWRPVSPLGVPHAVAEGLFVASDPSVSEKPKPTPEKENG